MQTVGHVAGATHFYSRQQLQNDPFPSDKVSSNVIRQCSVLIEITVLGNNGRMSSSKVWGMVCFTSCSHFQKFEISAIASCEADRRSEKWSIIDHRCSAAFQLCLARQYLSRCDTSGGTLLSIATVLLSNIAERSTSLVEQSSSNSIGSSSRCFSVE